MKLFVRKDVFDTICDSLGIEKAYKYIRRWEKPGGGWNYEYPSDMPRNTKENPKITTHRKARFHNANKTKVITGVKIIQNDEDYDREVNRLKQLSRKGQLKCKALGNENIIINKTTVEHTKTTKGDVRPEKEKYQMITFWNETLENISKDKFREKFNFIVNKTVYTTPLSFALGISPLVTQKYLIDQTFNEKKSPIRKSPAT